MLAEVRTFAFTEHSSKIQQSPFRILQSPTLKQAIKGSIPAYMWSQHTTKVISLRRPTGEWYIYNFTDAYALCLVSAVLSSFVFLIPEITSNSQIWLKSGKVVKASTTMTLPMMWWL